VVVRMLKEVTLFHSLFRSNKWIWLFGWMFHVGMLVVILRHLRYFQEPVWWWVEMIQWMGVYAGFAMLAGLLGLWLRRIVVERIRYITGPSDHLMLALLVSIAVTGLMMKYVTHTDIVAVKAYMLGIMYFDIQTIPTDPVLYIHLLLVAALLIVFPVSKLLHAPGVFFSPTRNQTDDSRRRRHIAPWAAKMESK
jgi:nitrate reductase gamma subunit